MQARAHRHLAVMVQGKSMLSFRNPAWNANDPQTQYNVLVEVNKPICVIMAEDATFNIIGRD